MRHFASLEQAFAYYTECQLATCEGLPKSTGKHARERLQNIANGMVAVCRAYKCTDGGSFSGTPRLSELLSKATA